MTSQKSEAADEETPDAALIQEAQTIIDEYNANASFSSSSSSGSIGGGGGGRAGSGASASDK